MSTKAKTILDVMKKEGKPMRPGDIAKKAKMEKDEVAKIIDQLKKEGKVASPKRCFYAPV
jgi:DNA-binding IclR family transcriptional regulator